jgi:Clostripain family
MENNTMADKKEWTIMVYMAGDNNLSEDMVTGLKGMMSIAGKGNFNLIACYDSGYPPIAIKLYDFSGDNPTTLGSNSERSSLKSEIRLKDFVIKNISSTTIKPEVKPDFMELEKFINFVIGKYKSPKYALILSGHSDGVIGRTLLRDENPNFVLDLKKLKRILMTNLPKDDNNKRKKFDLLGFDSCLMSMLEVGYEMRNVAEVLVASEGNIPTSGWAYEEVLKDLVKNSKLSKEDFAKSIVKRYISFNSDYVVGGRSVNTSACDLSKITVLSKKINKFAKNMLSILDLPREIDRSITREIALSNTILREQFINLILLSHYESQTFMHEQAVDVLDFIRNLLTQSRKKIEEDFVFEKAPKTRTKRFFYNKLNSIYKDYTEIRDAVSAYVLAEDKIGAEYQFSTGVSVFFPWSELALDLLYIKYKNLDFNKSHKAWLQFIEKFTNVTLRVGDTTQIKFKHVSSQSNNKFSEIEFDYSDSTHKEHGGREHGGREHGGRGELEAFYKYFSQVRNYSTDIDFVSSIKIVEAPKV